jgi:hypothetical protein
LISHLIRSCQFELKRKEMGKNKEKMLNFLDFIGWDHRAIFLQMYAILQDKGRMNLKVIQRSSGLLSF